MAGGSRAGRAWTTTPPEAGSPSGLNSLLGDSALVRFDRDVLGQAGVKYVILLEGINDIGLGNPDVTADEVIAGYRELIDLAHAAGLRIFGGTLTPAEGNPYPFYAPYDESKRAVIAPTWRLPARCFHHWPPCPATRCSLGS